MAAPGIPTSFTVIPGDAEALLEWVAPTDNGGLTITGYVITVIEDDGYTDIFMDVFSDSVSSTFSVTAPALGYVFAGNNGQVYEGFVRAVNADGLSGPTVVVTFIPFAGAGPLPGTPQTAPPPDPWRIPSFTGDPALLPPAQVPIPVGAGQVTPGPLLPATAALGSPTEGEVVALWLLDLVTGEVLPLLPSRGGIWLNDFDPGRPNTRDVIYNKPVAHGTIDQTAWYANRAATMALTCIAGLDVNGILQSASAWSSLVDAWTVLGRKVRMFYQLRGMHPRMMDVRYSSSSAPVVGSDVDRARRLMTLGFIAPDPFAYEVPLPGVAIDPARLDWYIYPPNGTGAGVAGGGDDFDFNGATGVSFPITFGGGSAAHPAVATIPPSTVGTVAFAPILTMAGGATSPSFTISDPISGVRSVLDFNVAVNGDHLVVPGTSTLIVDVANKTATVTDIDGTVTSVYKYLAVPAAWEDFLVEPQLQNIFSFSATAVNAGTTSYISYRKAFV